MSAPLTPATELEAVNEMLSLLGESPIATLQDNQVIEASLALRILRGEAVKLQNTGWHFNTDENFKLSPQVNGELHLPLNALSVDTTGDDAGLDLTVRGHRLYDRTRHTFEVGRAVRVNLILALPFEQLPSTVRSYVTLRASRIFQDRYAGDDSLHAYTKEDEREAYAAVINEEIENTDPNMLYDSHSVRRVLRRG